MTSAYELEWLKYQESENKKSSQEEKEEETIKIVVAKDEDEESEDIQEISMTVGGVNCVGYDITGNGQPDYCGFVNEETGEVDELVPMNEIVDMDVEIVIQEKKEKEDREKNIVMDMEPIEQRGPSLRFLSRSSLEIPPLMDFSLLDMTPKHSKLGSSLRTHASVEQVAEFNGREPPPPSPPPPGLGFTDDKNTIRVAQDADDMKNEEEEEEEDETIGNVRTVQLDTNGDGTIDCVGYFLDTMSTTPDYYGLVNENGEVDSLIPSDEFLKEHGGIDTLIRSHDYEFTPLKPVVSPPSTELAESKIRRTSRFISRLTRERSPAIESAIPRPNSKVFKSESKLSHISALVDTTQSSRVRSQGATRVKRHSKLMSPMKILERKRIDSNVQNVLIPIRSTEDQDRTPQISRYSRRVEVSKNQYHIAVSPSQQVTLHTAAVRHVDSSEDILLFDDLDRAPRVGRPQGFQSKEKFASEKVVVSPSARANLFQGTHSMRALLPIDETPERIPRNELSMRVQSAERLHDSIGADKKIQFENLEKKVEMPHIQSRPSFVSYSPLVENSIVRNKMMRREKPYSNIQAPVLTGPSVNRVSDIKCARPSFVIPGLMGSRTTVRNHHMSMYTFDPSKSTDPVSDAPKNLHVHELTAFPHHIATSSPVLVGKAQPRAEKIIRIPRQKAKIRDDIPTPRVTKDVFKILRRKNFEAKQSRAKIRNKYRLLNFLQRKRAAASTSSSTAKPPMSFKVLQMLRFLRKSSIRRGNTLRRLHQRIRTLKQSISMSRNRQRGLKLLLNMARLHRRSSSSDDANGSVIQQQQQQRSKLKLKTLERIIKSLLESLNWSASKIALLWSGIHKFHEDSSSSYDADGIAKITGGGDSESLLKCWDTQRRQLLFSL